MNVSEQIRRIRKAKQLSQQEVAEKMEIDRAQYSRIETGKSEPTLSSLEKIAVALEITLVDLFKNDYSLDVDSANKTIVEKVRLIEELDEKQKTSLYHFIDIAVANKRLKNTLSEALKEVS